MQKKSQVWCKGLNIGMTHLAECLALLLMFFKHIWALLGLSPSKGIKYFSATNVGLVRGVGNVNGAQLCCVDAHLGN